jgi:gamma-glutamyltranspeptidase/glutathione hydrolase
VLGSPGGSRIILYVVKSLIALIDWKLDAQASAALPNFGSRNGPFEAEPETLTEQSRQSLATKGHKFRISPMTSGTHIIVITADGFASGADPRREGLAVGK